MSQNNPKTNANSDSKDYTEETTNNKAVPHLGVAQPIINNDFANTSLSQRDPSDTLNETHTNNLWHRERIWGLLKQNRELREQVEILDLLERIREEGLVGNEEIKFRVSGSFKELYNKYYAPRKPTLSPKLQVIREAIFRIILDDLILSGKIDTETLRQFGFETPNVEEVRKAERVVYMPIIQKEEPKQEKRKEELKDEFKQKFKEFEKFLNELIFTQDNFVNGYVVTKPLAKKLFQHIDELVNMEGTPPEAKQLLREMEEHLAKFPLAEKNFKNGIASIPTGVHKEQIMPRLTKIEKLLS
jgi:hypothetical protein